ncbi:Spectrin repeat [Trinorchestia longiramus]|nr:Spectrin repeat [Trinorchestia longiramus]
MPVTDKEISLISSVSVCGSSFSTSVSPLKNVALARMNQNISHNENTRRNSSGAVFPIRNRSELFVPNINLNKRLFQNGLSRSAFSEKCQKKFPSHEINENGRSSTPILPTPILKSDLIPHQTHNEKSECENSKDDNSFESFSDAIRKECKALGRDSKCLWRQSALLWGDNTVPESHRSSWTGTSDNGTVSTTEGDADSRIWDTATSATTEDDDTPSEGRVIKRYSSESPSRNPVVRHCSSTTTEEDYSTCQVADFKRLSIDANVRKVVVRDGTPIISNLELNDETSEDGSACSEKACEEDTAAFLEKTSQLEHSVLDYLCSPTSVLRDNGTRETVTIDFEFWDLQSEIESHKDVVASLNATGQKLLGTLENQDEAMMLHRRLEEMNTRWNTLKHRSIAIRSRLEGNTESWNSLLLSLRELIEWVIRKDTELTAMGPPSGDMATLTKLESDLVSFRRVLDEKQPVVESNLKSGRQLIASEPPLSDTSDSEAGRDLDGDARRHGEESARELTRSVRREVAKLSEKWAALRERAAAMATNISLANKVGFVHYTFAIRVVFTFNIVFTIE